ncbi:outer membrane channel protein TolC [Microbulbifer flavimaris]|uniref:Outer membrane channel protein TolC n=1 Tax=Microbulbifer flavimaris TaxID=1781068 RepID=A0ABX4I2N4_9GAMM|nr:MULTISPECIES: TolC family outer membrane protein [Microbulbifer]KUJ83633.1 outer membrane channel protein TolC [Microbulbifer sp. ZGT114]PCO05794.1 outer membrane channel protein TolC [Microbulbifer flavimaris]
MKRIESTRRRSNSARRPLKSLLAAALLGLSGMQAQADTLWEIYLQALDNDPQLAADRAAFEAGLEAKNLGRSALLPQINGNAEHSSTSSNSTQFDYTFGPNNVISIPNSRNTDVDDEVYSARLDQAIFDLPAWFGYQQGKSVSEQAAAEFSANQQEMMLRVATTYFNVLRAYDVLEAAKAEEEALAKQLEQTRQRFEVGLTAITDVYDSQAAYENAVARRLTAEDNLLSNFDALSILTGTEHDQVAPLEDGFTVAPPEPAERTAWVDFALQNNFDLKAASLAADAARSSARAAAAEHLPTLYGSVSYSDFSREGSSSTSVPGEPTVELPINTSTESTVTALTLNVPIFTGGRLSASRREARNLSFQAQDLRNLVQRNTIQDTRTLHRNLVTDVSRVRAREQAVISAQAALEANQAGYEVGTRNIVDVLLAQRTLFQSKTDYANAVYDYIDNTLRLKRVAGLLAPADLQELEAKLNPATPVVRVGEAAATAAEPTK